MQFLWQHGYTEMNFAGTGMIMSDVAIEFKNELFYGDTIKVSLAITEISKVSFAMYYKLENAATGNPVIVAIARTGMVCYNYAAKKISSVPDKIRSQFTQ
jgi:acyl-CoA thioesterase FadM